MPRTVPAEPCLALQEDSGDTSGCRTRLEPGSSSEVHVLNKAAQRAAQVHNVCPLVPCS